MERLHPDEVRLVSHSLVEDREELELELQGHRQFQLVLGELTALPIKYQEVLALRFFEGKENKEIGDILGIKEGTLKSRISRGLEMLRKRCNALPESALLE